MIAQEMLTKWHCSEKLYGTISSCMDSAAKEISTALGRPIGIDTARVSLLDAWEVPISFWKPEDEIVAVYISISGDVQGYIVFYISANGACELIEMMRNLRRRAQTTLGTMERSALGEIAKLASIALCEALTGDVFFNVRLSPPAVLVQPASSVMSIPLADAIEPNRQALVAETVIEGSLHKVRSVLVITPEIPSLATVLEVLERRW